MTTTTGERVHQTLGNYDLLTKIGEGAMGTVYRSRDRRSGQIVAIKVVDPDVIANRILIKRFEQEFLAAKALNHPNIVRALDYCATQDIAFLVMEYVEGKSLGEILERHGQMPEAQAILLIAQVAQGLHHAHQQGLIHRDVKPDNILVTPDGHAKLADLGLAKELDTSLDLTRTGGGLGTPHFMAPEQFRNAKEANVRSDIFSLAATLYGMVTGELPFKATGPVATWTKMIKNDLIRPRQLVPGLSERVDGAIRKALSADPQLRPASCREFLDELIGKEIAAPPTSPEADLDLWYVDYQDEQGKKYSAVGTTQHLRRSLEGGLLGDPTKVRVGRTRSGVVKIPMAIADFSDLATRTPVPARPLNPSSIASDCLAASRATLAKPTAPVQGGLVSCPLEPLALRSPATFSLDWLRWSAVVALALAAGLLAGLLVFPTK
jgi:serine/threonine protein kinase